MEADKSLTRMLKKAGAEDILAWAAARPTLSLVELNRLLDADIAPVELQQIMAEEAVTNDQYDRFVRGQLVRYLNDYCPNGLGSSEHQPDFVQASIWSSWASLFEPSHREQAHTVYLRVLEEMQRQPAWVPRDADDPLLTQAFSGSCFNPTEAARKRKAAEKRAWQIAAENNRGYRDEKVLRNFRRAPAGYGLVYGLYTVDGQVCNGGFSQLYGNTAGAPVPFAIEALKKIGRPGLAAVVTESLGYAQQSRPDLLLAELRKERVFAPGESAPREFDVLDHEYYELTRPEDICWIETAIETLVMEQPELFA